MTKDKRVFEYYLYLKSIGFQSLTAKFILSQAAFETGNFTSNIFNSNNNMFGMKLPKKRPTTAIGEKFGHAVYSNDFASMEDYKFYWNEFNMPESFETVKDFCTKLKSNKYFEANLQDYIKGVKHYQKLYWDE